MFHPKWGKKIAKLFVCNQLQKTMFILLIVWWNGGNHVHRKPAKYDPAFYQMFKKKSWGTRLWIGNGTFKVCFHHSVHEIDLVFIRMSLQKQTNLHHSMVQYTQNYVVKSHLSNACFMFTIKHAFMSHSFAWLHARCDWLYGWSQRTNYAEMEKRVGLRWFYVMSLKQQFG